MTRRPLTIDEYLPAIEALCARSEQCSFEIATRLRRRGFTADQISRVIDDLIDRRFIDDTRFARAFVADRFRFARWGRIKIRAALIARRIPAATITEALESIDTRDYALTAFRVIASRLARLDHSLPRHELRRRLARFALSRGFEPSLIFKVLNSERLWQSSDD